MEIVDNGFNIDDENAFIRIEKYNKKTTKKLASLYKEVIIELGENIEREGLILTPLRIAKAMQFLTQGYNQDADKIITSALFKEDYKQMVIVKDIDLFSLCEHHMLPFYGKAHVAYIPNGYITGLSKIARVVETYARRLQVQERLTTEILECLDHTLKPAGVAVVIEAQHMCMQIRGIQKQNSVTTTSAFTGEFLNNLPTREEFIHLIGAKLK